MSLRGLFYGRMATPSAAKGTLPPAGIDAFYVDNSDDHLKFIDSAGNVTDITDTALDNTNISSSTPTLKFTDTDTTDQDVSATITVQATDTSTGAEDIDFTIAAQVAGTNKDIIAQTASNNSLVFGSASGQLLGFYGASGVNKGNALTAVTSAMTFTATAGTDATIGAVTSAGRSFGWDTKAEIEAVIETIKNNQTRIAELTTRLTDLNLTN